MSKVKLNLISTGLIQLSEEKFTFSMLCSDSILPLKAIRHSLVLLNPDIATFIIVSIFGWLLGWSWNCIAGRAHMFRPNDYRFNPKKSILLKQWRCCGPDRKSGGAADNFIWIDLRTSKGTERTCWKIEERHARIKPYRRFSRPARFRLSFANNSRSEGLICS